ncbi:hypothetical protein KUL49_33620 [Alteromonas sp. KUL49]|nr:hypothetical protein KUL49_33620 [Alteromonas sp. KUL49]
MSVSKVRVSEIVRTARFNGWLTVDIRIPKMRCEFQAGFVTVHTLEVEYDALGFWNSLILSNKCTLLSKAKHVEFNNEM